MYAKWTSKETQSLNLIIDSQQHNNLYLSQQQEVLNPTHRLLLLLVVHNGTSCWNLLSKYTK
jgi:hypothetical protein